MKEEKAKHVTLYYECHSKNALVWLSPFICVLHDYVIITSHATLSYVNLFPKVGLCMTLYCTSYSQVPIVRSKSCDSQATFSF